MERLEAMQILQEEKVLIAPDDMRTPQEIVMALGLFGIANVDTEGSQVAEDETAFAWQR